MIPRLGALKNIGPLTKTRNPVHLAEWLAVADQTGFWERNPLKQVREPIALPFGNDAVNVPDKNSSGDRFPASPDFPAEIQQAAERHVTHRLRHVTVDTGIIGAIRKLAVRRTAERLVHESQNRGQSKRH